MLLCNEAKFEKRFDSGREKIMSDVVGDFVPRTMALKRKRSLSIVFGFGRWG